jgi:hypothetical protein
MAIRSAATELVCIIPAFTFIALLFTNILKKDGNHPGLTLFGLIMCAIGPLWFLADCFDRPEKERHTLLKDLIGDDRLWILQIIPKIGAPMWVLTVGDIVNMMVVKVEKFLVRLLWMEYRSIY